MIILGPFNHPGGSKLKKIKYVILFSLFCSLFIINLYSSDIFSESKVSESVSINKPLIRINNSEANQADLMPNIDFRMQLPDALTRISEKLVFSHPGGFYSNPFTLNISTPLAGYLVSYTLDGSNPQNSSTRTTGGQSVDVLIDPLSTDGRPLTPAVVVRACLTGIGFEPSFPEGRTYIFTSEVSLQAFPGGEWPDYNVNGQIIDLPMDSKVVNDSRYSDKIDFSLKAIPSISIITDTKNVFNSDSGIYVNATMHGPEWERESSVELIYPDGTDGFQVNAGLRIRGGWSRHNNYPKHAFRLFFNSQYGYPKLEYPLFEDEGTSKFDKIDLRCEQNYSWANAGSGGPSVHNTCVREVFSRDMQREMGQPYSRSRYYHLYLNGMYWGLYQTQERTEANFASSYFGGKDVDYDVVKVNTENFNYVLEATDGDLLTWESIWNILNEGFSGNANYFKLEGKDIFGKRDESKPVLVDIDNLIDYMLVIFYTGNFDSPTSSFGGNKGCNNFFAIYNKTKKNKGFTFYVHDAEHAMMPDVVETGTGLYEDRVNLARRTDGANMFVYDFQHFHPQWLHEKLTANPEYRLRFADRAYKYLRAGNVLSQEACLDRFDSRASEISDAIISESARWGDSKGTFPVRTKDDHWIPELNNVRDNYIPYRTSILVNQLKGGNLLPYIEPSTIKIEGNIVETDSYNFLNSVTLSFQNPNAAGDVYYTLDNSDPRLIGGNVNPSATRWVVGSDFPISNSTVIQTRVLKDGVWSPLNFTNLLKTNEDYSHLKVTELMYHPKDFINGTDTVFGSSLEYIELKNTGATSINISGMMLDSAVRCTFPANTLLGPGQFYVIASKPNPFEDFYNFPPSDNYSGNFSNGGEYVLLTDPVGNAVISFTYSDMSPWPVDADGTGNSLNSVEVNPTGDPNLFSYWKASNANYGTPFFDDTLDSIDKNLKNKPNLIIYPNPTDDLLSILIDPLNSSDEYNIKIYNLGGNLLYENLLIQGNTISLREYACKPGIYIIKVESKKYVFTQKLVVTY